MMRVDKRKVVLRGSYTSTNPERSAKLRKENENIKSIAGFLPTEQKAFLIQARRDRQYEFEFTGILERLRKTIEEMPVTYEQEGKGDDAIVSLHYFAGGASDWWIIEKDKGAPEDTPEEFQSQAFGYVRLNGGEIECGYISIGELCASRAVSLDFHFKPRTVRSIKDPDTAKKLFIGVYPPGLVYADRSREVAGDYATLGFLSYETLKLELLSDCPEPFIPFIQADARAMEAKRGQEFEVSTSGQTILLGGGKKQ